ncbi:MAG: hypothetical protein H7267_11325 [Sandarakinorhabdus sp.]|nr:hypothetical protein [Sandarakinorhabdus sp.]
MRRLAFVLLLGAAPPSLAATPFEPADLYRISMVTDPKVAPDGNRNVFTKAAFDIQTESRTAEL